MAQKILKKAQWFWEDYVGAKWKNVEVANTGDNKGAYCYVQGKNSKSQYKPKSLFYHYQVTGIDSTKYKIDTVNFVLVIRKFNQKQNDFPTIKVFYGDNNAPYKKEPIKVVKTHTFLKNQYDYDNYTLNFTIKGLTIAQLKNVIIEVDWSRTKVTGESVISVNRGRLEVNYSLQDPKWALYSSISPSSATTNEKVAWKLTVKNTGYCSSSNSVSLSLPKGVSVVSSSGGGAYNNTTKTWTFGQICKGGSVTRTFYVKSSSVGLKSLVATNSSNLVTNKSVTQNVTFIQYIPPPKPKDVVTYTTYDEATFEKEPYQYFDINIQGYGNNHIGEEYVCYNLATSENVEMYLPLRTTAELIDDNNNIVELVTDSSIADTDNKLCLHLERISDDFVANIRVYMYCEDDTYGTVTTTQGNNTWSKEFDIFPKRGVRLSTDDIISRDTTYVTNSINIGVPNIWTIRANVSRNNFFDEKKEAMEIVIEDRIAYIGVIPLSRCHKADVTADSKNSLIENRYLNRAYYGKKGDYSEDIKMTLRIPWYDVATLQGLVEMDKPIPIDTIPNRADGDPLNHRGWAEIYEVTNIKKINDLYYECDVGVKYLSHDINTRFTITEAKKITEATIKYYLALVHDYNMDLLDIFKLNYYEFWTTLEDSNGDKIGSYDIDPNTTLIMNRDLNKHSTYDIVFRNTVPVLQSEDYDGNFEMALKVINKDNSNVLFEHDYNNFKHYDFTNQYAENSADATSKYLNGTNYETLNFEKIGLGYDELSPLIEDMKVATHFNTMENVVIQASTDQFEIFLLDDKNKGISNQVVNVKVTGDDNFTNSFNVISDRYGRVLFKVDWGDGNYDITLTFNENENYRGCTYNTKLNIQFDYVEYHFTYPTNPPTVINNGDYICSLLDDNDDGVSGVIVHYSFKTIGRNYEHEETAITDENGNITIPIKRPNGSHMLRVNFKGYTDNGTTYQPCQFESQINVLNDKQDVIIESDNINLIQGDSEKQYSIILKDKQLGTPMANEDVKIAFYNNDETFILNEKTNDYGIASASLYLKGGAWRVDSIYDGSETHNPCIETRDAIVDNFTQMGTYILCDNITLNEDKLLDGSQDYFKFYLYDDYGNPVIREPVSVKIYDNTATTLYIDTVFSTRNDGSVTVPFISHSENVIVQIKYNGSVKYTSSENECIISFESIINKYEQKLTKMTEQVINVHTGEWEDEDYIELKINNVVQNSWTSDLTIVNSLENERWTSDDEYTNSLEVLDHNALPNGTHKVTIFKKGNATAYSICRTFTLTIVNDGRPRWVYWCSLQDVESWDSQITYEILDSDEIKKVGDYAHIRFMMDVWIPNETVVSFISENDEFSTITTTNEMINSDGKRISYFDVYMFMPNWVSYSVRFWDSLVIQEISYNVEIPMVESTKESITVSQTGFAYDNETYQDLAITIAHNDDIINYEKGFYIIRVLNLETYEEMYYYSYISSNLNPSTIQFLLTKSLKLTGDNWRIEIFVAHDDTYKCGYYTTDGRIDTDTIIVTETTSIFVRGEEYIQLDDEITFTDNGFNYGGGV